MVLHAGAASRSITQSRTPAGRPVADCPHAVEAANGVFLNCRCHKSPVPGDAAGLSEGPLAAIFAWRWLGATSTDETSTERDGEVFTLASPYRSTGYPGDPGE